MQDRFSHLLSKTVAIWRGLSWRIRLVVISYCLIVVAIPFSLYWMNRSQAKPAKAAATPTPIAKPVEVAPTINTPKEIVINSADDALQADAFEDDDNNKTTIKTTASQPEMVRVANNWLVPQVESLEKQFKSLQRSVEKDRAFISQNQPLIPINRAALTQAEEDYRRASAALSLPSMPNSSFDDEIDARFKDAKTKLEKVRKQLKIAEDGVEVAEKRLEKDESNLAEMEVEINNMRERLDKVRNGDYKTLATTYQYAVSGLTTLPLLRFAGRGSWDVRYISEISTAFQQHFHRNMPISALGQSDTHNRLGWDHSHAADVPIHPGTMEGQWLMTYLRDRNIPFLAFRTAVRGVSTGPHFHIGKPSHRLQ